MRDVRVRVAAFHISVARLPNDVRVLALYAQIVEGREAIDAASDVDAVNTVELVFELTAVVPAEMAEAIDDEAVPIVPAVLAVPADIAAASDVEAVKTVEFVLLLTAVVIPEVCEFVLALITAARDDDAVPIVPAVEAVPAVIADASDVEAVVTVPLTEAVCAFVFAFTTAAIEVEAVPMVVAVLAVPAVIAEPSDDVAVVRFASVAREPDVRVASVRLRVAYDQI